MNYGPVSQERFETLRAASSQISNAWDKLVEPVKGFGENVRRNPESDRGCSMSKKDKIKISVKEAYWVLDMFKKLERVGMELTGVPLAFKPEVKAFRNRLIQKVQKLREEEARAHERSR